MAESTPICRCRVLYLGSAVPRQSKDGLQGIQEPLRSLYPSEGAIGAKGIDSWLSVWSNGILLENVDENLKQVTRFFPIESLHYCAAVRQVLIPERGSSSPPEPKFLPLDSPFARMPKAQHPPIFAAILRRTTGIKVLECHVFICKREAAANALVRCCFHAYADNSYAKQLESGPPGSAISGIGISGAGSIGGGSSVYGTLGGLGVSTNSGLSKSNGDLTTAGISGNSGNGWRSRAGSTTTLNSVGRTSNGHHQMLLNGNGGIGLNGSGSNSSAAEGYTSVKNFYASSADLNIVDIDGDGSIFNGDENHKVWNGSHDQLDGIVNLESPYEVFSGNSSTLGRPARARQISAPIPVPPPPMKEETKKKKDKKSSKSGSSQSLSGTLIRPKPIHANSLQRPTMLHHHHHHPSMGPPPPGSVIYGPIGPHAAASVRQYHTFSHRGIPNGMTPTQQQGPPPPHHHHHHHHHHHPNGPSQPPPPPHMIQTPLAAMHQLHHSQNGPVPIIIPQQYATLQPSKSNKKKKSKNKSNGTNGSGGIPVGMPIIPSMYAPYPGGHPPPPPALNGGPGSMISESRPLAMSNRKLAQSAGNGLDDSGNSGAESPGGTGIYRRKGHLNERAFSYSIRQEHRSRSHGSLASLQFNPPDMKKEREIAQMVAGLDLNDDLSTMQHRKTSASLHQNGNIPQQQMNGNIYGPVSGNYGKPRR
ncbi:uncharacterized protein LOC129613027 [Condylostylus longicornis]|uniref:uncharacterized protein LOC129613027 n=1 Tax=Condylostylus longicornis TaxID=2530218 RepID=UPI00244DCBA4|nr:uncharacterized protein LOC129613027 [Condylostylus longicornis]XP_055382885.1 uncharacterized protein LOC129613027 [Condylostylus longicornis]